MFLTVKAPPITLKMIHQYLIVRVRSQDVLNSLVAGHGLQSHDILYEGGFGRGA
jgi:hypothetical protein